MIRELIHNLFPDYYRDKDTYKNSDGRGLFERFMDTFSTDIDEEILPKIESLVPNIVNYDGDYWRELTEGFGNEYYLINDDLTIKLAKTWIRLMHHKGTRVGLDILLKEILWVDYELVDVTDYILFHYDSNDSYDTGGHHYDSDCSKFLMYRINLTVTIYPPTQVTPQWVQDQTIVSNNLILSPYIAQLVKLINALQPVNAVLDSLYFNGVQQPITGGFNIGFNQSFN